MPQGSMSQLEGDKPLIPWGEGVRSHHMPTSAMLLGAQVSETDDGTFQTKKRDMYIFPALVPDCRPTAAATPGQCALHNPPASAQALA